MKKPLRTNPKSKRLKNAAALLRLDYGSISRISRRLGVSPSLVSRVARGQKSSRRVREAVIRESIAIARTHSEAALRELE